MKNGYIISPPTFILIVIGPNDLYQALINKGYLYYSVISEKVVNKLNLTVILITPHLIKGVVKGIAVMVT